MSKKQKPGKNPGKNTAKKAPKKQSNSKQKTIKSMVEEHGNKTGIMPLGSRVLVKPYTREEIEVKNNFGIILPEKDSKEKSEQGMVIAVGKGEYVEGKLVPMTVKVGDKVAFSKYGYEEITAHGEDYFLIKEDAILAIIK